ncbi:DNA repair protein RecO, partial [Kaistia algarum]
MRNEVLHGYLIHHRKYRERSHIVHLFTQEHGRVDGILRQTPQASGKSELKNFTKLEIVNQPIFFFGDAFFSGFYLNEILLRLCPLEVQMEQSFAQYAHTLTQLQQLAQQADPNQFLKQILRQFEHELLEDLGYALDFSTDANQLEIQSSLNYIFQLNEGFIPTAQASRATLNGQQILSMCQYEKGRDFGLEQLQLL